MTNKNLIFNPNIIDIWYKNKYYGKISLENHLTKNLKENDYRTIKIPLLRFNHISKYYFSEIVKNDNMDIMKIRFRFLENVYMRNIINGKAEIYSYFMAEIDDTDDKLFNHNYIMQTKDKIKSCIEYIVKNYWK